VISPKKIIQVDLLKEAARPPSITVARIAVASGFFVLMSLTLECSSISREGGGGRLDFAPTSIASRGDAQRVVRTDHCDASVSLHFSLAERVFLQHPKLLLPRLRLSRSGWLCLGALSVLEAVPRPEGRGGSLTCPSSSRDDGSCA
jgi:hypothetical protein